MVVDTNHYVRIIEKPVITESNAYLEDEIYLMEDGPEHREDIHPGIYIASLDVEYEAMTNPDCYGEIRSYSEFINFIPLLNFPFKRKGKKKIRQEKKRMELFLRQFDWD